LDILGNKIQHCLARGIVAPDSAMLSSMGYGAIQLADVSDCLIKDNTLVDNGPSHIPALCGVYVLHAAGIDISGNHIVNNGAKTSEPEDRGEDGARAGVYIAFATVPSVMAGSGLLRKRVPFPSGAPAVKAHDNIVRQPVGQALYTVALGPVSVEGNQLTSHGNLRRAKPLSPTFLATTALIFDLGLSNEDPSQFLAFSYQASAKVELAGGETKQFVAEKPAAVAVRPERVLGRGNVMFVDNQVTIDSQQAVDGLALTSVAVLSLDDVAFESNQCDCNVLSGFVLAQVAVLGASARIVGNRFKEGRTNAVFSAITYGMPMNCTSQNQASHCIVANSNDPADYLVFSDNRVRWGPLGAGSRICERYLPKWVLKGAQG
jgi:hypothetical protein